MVSAPARSVVVAPLLVASFLAGCGSAALVDRSVARTVADDEDATPGGDDDVLRTLLLDDPPGPAPDARAGDPVVAERMAPVTSPPCVPAPLERRAAAVLVVGLPGVTDADDPLALAVADLGVGGVFVSETNIWSRRQLRELVEGFRARSTHPVLMATDEESGRVATARQVVGWSPTPRSMAVRYSPDEVRERAQEIGMRLQDVGVDVDLAPVLDLDDGPWDGIIGDRSFSADPDTAATYGLAFAAGLADVGVVPTMKHFPGHGGSSADTHVDAGVVTTSWAELGRTDLVPFRRAIDAGAPVVMVGHLQYDAIDPDVPASLAPEAYRLLRETGFTGVAITDSIGMGAVHSRWDFPDAAVRAVTAGADAVLATDGRHATRMRDAIVAAVRDGRLPVERLDEAAARVTALAGGNPLSVSCVEVHLPELQVHAQGDAP